jgi:hypothetical protein
MKTLRKYYKKSKKSYTRKCTKAGDSKDSSQKIQSSVSIKHSAEDTSPYSVDKPKSADSSYSTNSNHPRPYISSNELITLIVANKFEEAINLIDTNKYLVYQYETGVDNHDPMYYALSIGNTELINKIIKAKADIQDELYSKKITRVKQQKIKSRTSPRSTSTQLKNLHLDGYDPFLNERINKQAWLDQHPTNIVITYNGIDICLNTNYFTNTIEENLILPCVIQQKTLLFQETMEQPSYINLMRYGFGTPLCVLETEMQSITNTKRMLTMQDTPEEIVGINKEFIVHNPSSYDNTLMYGVEYQHELPLKRYTSNLFKSINGYLRTNKLDTHTEDIVHYVSIIDNAFHFALKFQEQYILYRGFNFDIYCPKHYYDEHNTCKISAENQQKTYDEFEQQINGIELGYLSTTSNFNIAGSFTGDGVCCILKLIVDIGVPYIYLNHISEHRGESEFLLPRNLVIKLIKSEMTQTIHGDDKKILTCSVSLDDPTRYDDTGDCKKYKVGHLH